MQNKERPKNEKQNTYKTNFTDDNISYWMRNRTNKNSSNTIHNGTNTIPQGLR